MQPAAQKKTICKQQDDVCAAIALPTHSSADLAVAPAPPASEAACVAVKTLLEL
jgi:hypothetical protein